MSQIPGFRIRKSRDFGPKSRFRTETHGILMKIPCSGGDSRDFGLKSRFMNENPGIVSLKSRDSDPKIVSGLKIQGFRIENIVLGLKIPGFG